MRSAIAALFDGAERRAQDVPWVRRLLFVVPLLTEDRILQLSVAAVLASLWLTLALADVRFLVLLPAAVVVVKRVRRLEREAAAADDTEW
jgi:hypothetical protein